MIWTGGGGDFPGHIGAGTGCRWRACPLSPLAWAGIALFGVFNLVQVGLGLFAFGPLLEAGEPLSPVFQAVLGTAFFFFFAAKALIGLAGIVSGASLWKETGRGEDYRRTGHRDRSGGVGDQCASPCCSGGTWPTMAGAIGTAATLFVACAIVMRPNMTAVRT